MLSIFIPRASEHLTDHEPHGDGLICFSLLNGLATRGHNIYAYSDGVSIERHSSNLHPKYSSRRFIPSNSLKCWEYGWQADAWLNYLVTSQRINIDLVWRMHPYGGQCPYPPKTLGCPLVLGPLFYDWPVADAGTHSKLSKLNPIHQAGLAAERGWRRTINVANLIICATDKHAEAMQSENKKAQTLALPVIVDVTKQPRTRRPFQDDLVRLAFVANLMPNKNPQVFCEIIRYINQFIKCEGTVVGDGPERDKLEQFCRTHQLMDAVKFRGKVSNAEVQLILLETDFLVSTSFGEPYGRSIVEAMAVGTPSICHKSGGPEDIITDGNDSLLVADLTAQSFAKKIHPYLISVELWKQLSENAIHKAKDWTSDAVLSRLERELVHLVMPTLSSSGIAERYY